MKPRPGCRKRQRGAASTWVFGGFALVALFFLLTEHRAHLYGWWPYLLVSACPLLHLFHGHGGHRGHGTDDKPHRRGELPPSGQSNPDAAIPPAAHHHR